MEPLEGLAQADAHLGRWMPLPRAELPLVRWVEVFAVAPGAVEVAYNLDDTRDGAPGRLSLYAGAAPPQPRELADAVGPEPLADGISYRAAPLAEAQPSLRPVHELSWTLDGLHLRLTAQGPWRLEALTALAQSVR
jgi:hypothetical protein